MNYLLLFTILIVLVETSCIWCIKHGKSTNKAYCKYIGISGFLLVGFLFYKALEHGDLGQLGIILEGLTIISLFMVGYFVFEEHWSTNKTIALLLSFISIYIIYREEQRDQKLGYND
jgi:multidrug transporter EmrE-like cation transporter